MGRSFEAVISMQNTGQERICNYEGDGAVEEGHLKTEAIAASITPKRWINKQFTRSRNRYSVITHSFVRGL